MDDSTLLAELLPTAERLVDRHLGMAKEWFPHDLVQWRPLPAAGEVDPEAVLSDGIASALFVNVLTEDNLPYYFASIDNLFGRDGAWGYWTRRWTAEEGRHSIVIRDYLIMSGHIDPVTLERARMAQVTGGVTPQPTSIPDAFAYLALQELATRIAHHNTGKALPDGEGYTVMKRVAADENLHYLFYRDLVLGRFGGRPVGDDRGHQAPDPEIRDARRRDPGLRPARQGHRPGRDLRPVPAPRLDPEAGHPGPLGRGQQRRADTLGRGGA